jgi:hypothetical protein
MNWFRSATDIGYGYDKSKNKKQSGRPTVHIESPYVL